MRVVSTQSSSGSGSDRFTDPSFARIRQGAQVKLSPEAARAVQAVLVDLGFLVPHVTSRDGTAKSTVDGDWGSLSETAFGNFQVHAQKTFPGLKVSKRVDKMSLQALETLSPPPGQNIVSFARGKQRTPATQSTPGVRLPEQQWGGRDLRVLLVKDEHRTFLFDAQGEIAGVFPNAHGKPNEPRHVYQTSAGLKVVSNFVSGPELRETGKRLWNDPDVFGPYYVDLSWVADPANGRRAGRSPQDMHGTSVPRHLGKKVSHGCMRHENAAITQIRQALSVGDLVGVSNSITDPRLSAGLP